MATLSLGDACATRSVFRPVAPTFDGGLIELPTVDNPDAFSIAPPGGGWEPERTVAFTADLDGDGLNEVVISGTRNGVFPTRRPSVFRYVAARGAFVPAAPLEVPPGTTIAGAVDLDGDGVLDLIANGVAWGRPGGHYDVPVPFVRAAGDEPDFASASYLDDIDQDGWLDVLRGSDQCCAACRDLHPLVRVGPRAYRDLAQSIALNPQIRVQAAFSATLGSGDRILAGIGWSCDGNDAPIFYRVSSTDSDGYPMFAEYSPLPADSLVAGDGGQGLSFQAPMGAALGDLDGDGVIDLGIAANPEHYLFQGRNVGTLMDRSGSAGYYVIPSPAGIPMLPWGMAFVDLDQDGMSDVVTAHGIDVPEPFPPHPDPERTTVHWNAGGFQLLEVTDRVGIGRLGQWHGLSIGDIDGDGAADVLVGAQGELPRVYLNTMHAGHHGFALKLRGTTSNHLGIGSHIEVRTSPDSAARSYFMGGIASPDVLSEPIVFVGLGSATLASEVRITWPSGTIQSVRDVRAGGTVTIEEPPVLTLEPSSRHLRADGASTMTVRVTPRDLDGHLRPDATLALEMTTAGARTAIPLDRAESGWVARIVAPASPGSSVLELRVDGQPIHVRPRIWWDGP